MNGLSKMLGICCGFVKECKSHCVMSIGNRKPDGMMKQSACRRKECLAKNHGSDGHNSNPVVVIERFGKATYWAGEEALVVPGSFSKGIEPFGKVSDNAGHLVS